MTRATVLVAMLLAVGGFAQEADEIRVVQVADFEDEDWARGWELPGAERDDWGGEGETGLVRSDDWASRGDASAKLTFGAWAEGEGDWRVIHLRLGAIGAGDWRGIDALEFDARVEGGDGVRLHVLGGGVEDPNQNRLFSTTIPPGEWTVVLRVDEVRVPNADLSQIDLIRFATRANPDERVLYVDDIRLVDRSGERLAELTEALSVARDVSDDARVAEPLQTAEQLRQDRAGEHSPDEWQLLRGRLASLTEQARPVLAEVAREHVGAVAETIGALAVPRQSEEMILRLDPPQPVAAEARVDALELTQAALQQQLRRARLKAAIQRQFADADFAVGIPEAPMTLTPDAWAYEGPLGREAQISAARGEFESAQLVILAHENDLAFVRVTAGLLRGPGVIAPEQIQVAPMGWRMHPTDEVHYADMLRPDVPPFDVQQGQLQPVWVTVHVPRSTPAGEYEGALTIESAAAPPMEIALRLNVWPFALPERPSMQTATHGWGRGGEMADRNARFVIEHRLNAMSIYQWPDPPPVESMARWNRWGADLFNLKRISRMGPRFEQGPDGALRFKEGVRNDYLLRIEKRIVQIEQQAPQLRDHLCAYGFDELGPNLVPAMERFFGELKERWPYIRTMTSINVPLWENQRIDNLDIAVVVPRLLTPEVRDLLRRQGMEVWWYNLAADQRDPALMRAQFWATMADDLEGVLHWNLGTGDEAGPYGEGLWPEPGSRAEDSRRFTWGALIRRGPDGQPLSTIALECWRDGLEDCDYLALLRERVETVEELPAGVRAENAALLRHAREMAEVPHTVSEGIMAGDLPEGADPRDLHTRDGREILRTRERCAELIVALDELLDASAH
ncbi:MAG: hypothetical protein GF393_02585 [Armatimonadia bacterium]|nr:hypothetical protein [Armatimonadia bacterium]